MGNGDIGFKKQFLEASKVADYLQAEGRGAGESRQDLRGETTLLRELYRLLNSSAAVR